MNHGALRHPFFGKKSIPALVALLFGMCTWMKGLHASTVTRTVLVGQPYVDELPSTDPQQITFTTWIWVLMVALAGAVQVAFWLLVMLERWKKSKTERETTAHPKEQAMETGEDQGEGHPLEESAKILLDRFKSLDLERSGRPQGGYAHIKDRGKGRTMRTGTIPRVDAN